MGHPKQQATALTTTVQYWLRHLVNECAAM